MKITVIGKTNHLFWLENVVDAFERSGYQTQKISTNKLGIQNDIRRSFTKIINKQIAYQHSMNIIQKKILNFVPDLIIVISPLLLPESLAEMIQSLSSNIYKIAWIGDKYDGLKNKNKLENIYHKIYYTDSGVLEYANMQKINKNNFYLPLAVNEIRFRNKNFPRTNQLLFIASPTDDRARMISHINNTRIKLIGKNWNQYIEPNSFISLSNRNIPIESVVDEYNRSKYVLNIKDNRNVINGLNMRTFEVISSGSCLIQDYVKDIELNFSPGKDIITYKNPHEIADIIHILDKNPKYREELMKNSLMTVLSKHTYMHRVKTIIDEL